MKIKAFRTALKATIPVYFGYLFLGLSYGILLTSRGFSFLYPMLMSLFIFAGTIEFLAVSLFLSAFNPMYALILAMMVNARHLFYGVSMLSRYRNLGWRKWYMIFGLVDETFMINCTAELAEDVDRGWFMFFVTALDHFYWTSSATLGGLIGTFIKFNTKGLDFVMTAIFTVMLLNQLKRPETHRSALVGFGASALCLLIFGSRQFIIPAMLLIVMLFTVDYRRGGSFVVDDDPERCACPADEEVGA